MDQIILTKSQYNRIAEAVENVDSDRGANVVSVGLEPTNLHQVVAVRIARSHGERGVALLVNGFGNTLDIEVG